MSKKSKSLARVSPGKALARSARSSEVALRAEASEITEASLYAYGAGSTTVASLMGSGKRGARARQVIYEKWSQMESDGVISSALLLLVTAALGGHESTGQQVFIEAATGAKGDTRKETMVSEMADALGPIFNRVAFQCAYEGATFGDKYARVYAADGLGLIDLYVDEMVRAPMVQPFEKGSRTVGYAVYTGARNFERLDVSQMIRLKMPRTQWIPQYGVVEKALRLHITEDDADNLPVMPSMVGGSLLYNAEEPYDNLSMALLGLVGQRWMDSIDEEWLTLNMSGMTTNQQKLFLASIESMVRSRKDRLNRAVDGGRPDLQKMTHIIPTWDEKQVSSITGVGSGQPSRAGSITIDDVMVHMRMLSGALGVDLSLLGFADQLSGGWGDGGAFRVSAQMAERARTIRGALADFFNQAADIHTFRRYGIVFTPAERPWRINYSGSISALEAEKQATRSNEANAAMLLVQAMQMFKEMGATKDMMSSFLTKNMMMDEDQANLFAPIVEQKAPDAGGDGDSGPSGFGGAPE